MNFKDRLLIKKAKSLSVSSERLGDNRELYPVEWLLKERSISLGYTSKLEMIKDMILEMNKNHPNYQNSTLEDKVKIEKLIQNPDVVDIVIVSLFQWFGTNVGKSDIGRLLDEIRELKYERININDNLIGEIMIEMQSVVNMSEHELSNKLELVKKQCNELRKEIGDTK